MSFPEDRARTLVAKIRELPPERVAEVEDFIDFLRLRAQDRALTRDFGKRTHEVLGRIWENDEDAVYDDL